MSELIGIVGQTGTGKSTSVEKLDPKETVIICLTNKPLPFRGWKKQYVTSGEGKNYLVTHDSAVIVKALTAISEKQPQIKQIIIDDFQYLMSTEFMNRAKESGWDKFTDIAKHAWDVVNAARGLRDDLKIYILTHDETVQENYKPKRKIKTIGKMIDEKVTLEGLFTVVLFTDVIKKEDSGQLEYVFITQNDGTTTAKSPRGMFEDMYIPNDLSTISKQIDAYYEGE